MNITLDRNKLPRLLWVGCARCGWQGRAGRLAALLVLLGLPLLLAAAPREPGAERLQQALRRFPDADLNKDGKLTLDEWREFRRRMQTGGAAEASRAASNGGSDPPSFRRSNSGASDAERVSACGSAYGENPPWRSASLPMPTW